MFCSLPVGNAEQNHTMGIAYTDHAFSSETIKQGRGRSSSLWKVNPGLKQCLHSHSETALLFLLP